MPELPEVETVVRQLRPVIIGKELLTIHRYDSKVANTNLKQAQGKIIAVSRQGKSIVLHLSSNTFLLAHLRMTGYFRPNGQEKAHLAASLQFTDNSWLNFHDIRRFAKLKLIFDLDSEFSRLGPDPLEMDGAAFTERLKRYPQGNIKNKLMDQACLAGIGNIYAQEALYRAGIDPRKKIGKISLPRLKALHTEVQQVLTQSIARNGTTVSNYSHLDGKGSFQDFLTVYQKEKCPQQHPLQREVIGGRGTWWCKKCQR